MNRYPYEVDAIVVNGHLSQHRYDFYGADTQAPTLVVDTGLAQAGSSTSVTLATTASSTDNAYRGYGFRITAGTGSGQDLARISAYNGTTKVATLTSALVTALDATSVYQVINRGYA